MIDVLLKTGRTVFTVAELQSLFADIKKASLAQTLKRYKAAHKLLNPQKGVWTFPIFSQEELACVLYPQGYISLETVLYEAGVIFQRYGGSTRMIWNNTRKKSFQEHDYYAFKLKDSLLTNPLGVRRSQHISKATPERALCDLIYLQQKVQIDNPDFFDTPQSKARFLELLPLYPQTTQNAIKKLLKS